MVDQLRELPLLKAPISTESPEAGKSTSLLTLRTRVFAFIVLITGASAAFPESAFGPEVPISHPAESDLEFKLSQNVLLKKGIMAVVTFTTSENRLEAEAAFNFEGLKVEVFFEKKTKDPETIQELFLQALKEVFEKSEPLKSDFMRELHTIPWYEQLGFILKKSGELKAQAQEEIPQCETVRELLSNGGSLRISGNFLGLSSTLTFEKS